MEEQKEKVDLIDPEHLHTDYRRWAGKPGEQFFKFLKGKGRVMLHEQIIVSTADGRDNLTVGFEVTIAKFQNKDKYIGSNIIPRRYYRPSDGDWGQYGWTSKTYEGALKRYNDLLIRQDKGELEVNVDTTQ
jgi:transposase